MAADDAKTVKQQIDEVKKRRPEGERLSIAGVSWTRDDGMPIDSIDSIDEHPRPTTGRADRPDLRRRPAPAGRDRRRAERGRHHHPGLPAHRRQRAAALGRHGHGDRGADGHRHGPPGRPRGAAPQPRGRGAGPAGRPREAVRGGHGHPPRDHDGRRDARRGRRAVRPLPDLGAAGRRRRRAAARHRHQPRPALRDGHDAPRRRGHDARCRWSPARSASPRTTRWRCSPGTRSRSCRSSTTPAGCAASSP